ncbi:hypothetical protein ACOT81_43810 [Streptomyces sp. WI04-05B]|uniref:hypothetical protein n=1 Tax=Streptomyces TaxID=1883 RepID=UPI0029BE99B0|nr:MULTISPECIES: hypothetical protein [unclassified Streptomyces]MDX2548285.1 hypothetical protein [Streptomyces sp. WI04-05B]MDX2586661.1 hypothetical protein [Streptomyces sp. WI04-05A]MDX3746241.1 hypothetical protein [Streptomyces sp. AK08-02]
MSASPAIRSLRAAVFAAVCVLLAAAAHALATGGAPSAGADGAGFAGVFAAGWLLGGRERSLPGIGALMLVTQAGLHAAFGAFGSVRVRVMSHAHHAGMHGMHGMRMSYAHAGTTNTMNAMSGHAVAAHVVAALVASWCLRRGEAALWSLLRWAVALVPGLAAWWRNAPLGPSRTAPGRMSAPDVRPRRLLLRYAVSGRGPPTGIPYTP